MDARAVREADELPVLPARFRTILEFKEDSLKPKKYAGDGLRRERARVGHWVRISLVRECPDCGRKSQRSAPSHYLMRYPGFITSSTCLG